MKQALTQCQKINAEKLKLAIQKKEDESILIHINDKEVMFMSKMYHKFKKLSLSQKVKRHLIIEPFNPNRG